MRTHVGLGSSFPGPRAVGPNRIDAIGCVDAWAVITVRGGIESAVQARYPFVTGAVPRSSCCTWIGIDHREFVTMSDHEVAIANFSYGNVFWRVRIWPRS